MGEGCSSLMDNPQPSGPQFLNEKICYLYDSVLLIESLWYLTCVYARAVKSAATFLIHSFCKDVDKPEIGKRC